MEKERETDGTRKERRRKKKKEKTAFVFSLGEVLETELGTYTHRQMPSRQSRTSSSLKSSLPETILKITRMHFSLYN